MSRENPHWGEDTIALEMRLKLGVEHAASTIGRYMVRDRPSRSTWRSFLSSHAAEVFALDFTMQPLWNYKTCYVLVIMVLDTRRVVHTGVTASPTLAWVQQQIREATPWNESPRFLLHDNDGIFGQRGADARRQKRYRCTLDEWLQEAMHIRGIPIPYGAPNASPHIERFMGTLRRGCWVHFIFLSERHLARIVAMFASYYNESRTHQATSSIPAWSSEELRQRYPVTPGRLVSIPKVCGVHHDYRLAA